MKRKPMITLILGISTLVLAGPLALYPAYTGGPRVEQRTIGGS